MATHTSRRVGVLAGLAVGLAGLGALVGVGFSYEQSDLPDLEPLLPTNHSNPNDRWVDFSEATAPGKTLYRFDTVIANTGTGAWAVSRADSSIQGQPTNQIIFAGGAPGGSQTAVKVADFGTANAIRYSPAAGHNHFHTQLVAAYDLLTTGGAKVASAGKNLAGFCLYDSWVLSNEPDYFPNSLACHPNEPDYLGPIDIGLSAGWGDFYGSQLGDQWIDVTAVTPGNYQIRATVNPSGIYQEKTTSNNSITDDVVIPGATAAAASAGTAVGTPVDIPISGTVVGHTVKSRIPGCADTSLPQCMTTATAGKLSFQASGSPSAGTVQIVDSNASDAKAVAVFTPPAGFDGTATFAYTAKDSRGLVSKPATVTVTVGTGGSTGGTGGGTTGGGTTGDGTTGGGAKATVKLRPSFRLVHSGSRRLLAVKGRLPKSQAGRLVRVQRRIGKRVTTIGGVRVAKSGRFSKTIRVHVSALSVRAALGSNAGTKAALSSFRRVTG